ncbi:uncharacterized protein MONOS_11258 [Monocercomonoides exilis]|uniref:uncharacterized protein n=1 Tax=Monocercomonoides exilis TaxID=2049356 RepID=UPI003559A6D6|nr:hypothetical protein MONOS_11258 [Monocercomonoides exilis]|eukprot:MONOS_11258.1-p1 / transcript=MONOS_11258.1 / gene=MONOS_11258 / organism=Monocercomonoides_exilis_PA203 / gene_product=unspecified product / transcript_product=unspecified product / location=Mono_scaffold00555:6306-6966(+) / protein_length=105 / sequence_SO=supercontig / SO=protein_coding / is_pseudo=false
MEGSKILADSAYVGARPELGAIISEPDGTKEISSKMKKEAKRIANERYNTRIKDKLNPGNMPAHRISSLGAQREAEEKKKENSLRAKEKKKGFVCWKEKEKEKF